MSRYGSAFGRGLLIGAGAALAYAASRSVAAPARARQLPAAGETPRRLQSSLLDWSTAIRIAERIAGQTPIYHPVAKAQLQAEYEALIAEIEDPIAAYTGNRLPLGNTRIVVADRGEWIRANVATFRHLLQPVEDYFVDSLNRRDSALSRLGPARQASQLVLSAEVGILLGYMARRVLGQYDLGLMTDESAAGGTLYFVEPNIHQVANSLGLNKDQFRRWIALHEATHAHEFELHPWVRGFLDNSMRAYLRLLIHDLRQRSPEQTLLSLLNRMLRNVRGGRNLLMALMSAEQYALISRLQALMSLAEGYSDHVMNAVGRELLPNFDYMHQQFEHRRQDRSDIENLFLKVTGLSMKMEQYKLGEQFVTEVALARGVAFANRAWESEATLPSEAEIRDPQQWIRRMEEGERAA
jgi:coenzyme F420 biosynthesis associated uncharacterized protein